MAYRLPGSWHIKTTNRTILCKSAALSAVLPWLLLFNACAGISAAPSSGAPSPSLIISAELPSASVGLNYAGSVTATGGTSPYLFSLASGQLPTGVLLGTTTGAISGTPSATGSFSFAISVSDSKGLSKQQPLQITVSTAPNQGNSFSKLQNSIGWAGYGQGPPDFVDCSPSPCDGITYSMSQGITSPSMSGAATQYNVGGTADYSDALFNNHLIGDFSSQGMPDPNHTIIPSLHNFTYDVYFYGTNLELSQAVEFDVNQFFDNLGFIWGHECRVAGGNEWDIWDNINQHWVPTGVSCYPKNNAWNHLTIQVQRTSTNQLLYKSITLNGVTSAIDQYYNPGAAVGWYGVTINYQMDGNYEQSPYAVYLDNLTFTYE
jgi:putative Ig domain-containing protein